MYNNFNSKNNEFSRMQKKIKDTIESLITDNHICNPSNNSSSDNITPYSTDNKYL